MQSNPNDFSAFITRISSLDNDLVTALDFVNWKDYVKRDSKVFVKPNFTYPYHKDGITTRPELLRSLLGLLKSRADRVLVGESDGGNNSFSADDSSKGHDMDSICAETGAEFINLSKEPSSFVEERIMGKKVKIQVPNLLSNEIDCFVSVPVLKVHVMTGVTLSIKNLWGCYPDTMRCLHHQNLDLKLALLLKTLNPKLVVVDGAYALDMHGPMYGNPLHTNILVASNNAVVADSLCSAIMGVPLDKASHIRVAEIEGLGTTSLERVRMNQEWKNYSMQFNVHRTLIDNASVFLFNSEILSRIVMNSPLTPAVYAAARMLRNVSEKEVASDLQSYYAKKPR